MRNCRKPCASALVLAGAGIVAAIALPSAVWWTLLGAALVYVGITLCRR